MFARHLAKGNELILCDPHAEKRETLAAELHVKATGDIAFAVRGAQLVVLAVKPGDLLGVAKAVEGEVLSGQKSGSVSSREYDLPLFTMPYKKWSGSG